MPLVKLVDAVVPDPPFRRQFSAQVDSLMQDAPKFASADELSKTFQTWRDMGPGFGALVMNAPVLASASSRVLELQKLGSGGLEALEFLRSGRSAPDEWRNAQLALVQQAETPDSSLLKLPWLSSYRMLVLAAANVGSLRNTDRSEWLRSIREEAASLEPKQKYTW